MDANDQLTRRVAIGKLTASTALTFVAQHSFAKDGAAKSKADDYFFGDRLYQDVVAYSNFGEHRTATDVDKKTWEWLAAQLKDAGLKTELHPFTLRQFFVDKVGLKVGSKSVEVFPMWPPRPTGPTPLRAKLVKAPEKLQDAAADGKLKGRIVIVDVPVRGASITPRTGHVEIVEAMTKAGAVGIVAVTPNATGELMALNSMRGANPWPVPIVLVGPKDVPILDEAVQQGVEAEMHIEGRDDANAVSNEVVGRRERGKKLIVVSTPYSGWFRCAGERGPGIALWLAVARWAARRPSDVSYLFVASSAHELDGAGIRHFVEKIAPPPDQVTHWLHLGAGIATYEYERGPDGPRRLSQPSTMRGLMTNDRAMIPILEKHFAGQRGLQPRLSRTPLGEMVLMASKGYRVWGFAGGSAFHHMPGDLPERITGPELLEPVGRSIMRTLEELESNIRVK